MYDQLTDRRKVIRMNEHETEDERIKRETLKEAHLEAERDLERIARRNAGLKGARE